MIAGPSVSLTVTFSVQVAVLPAPSVAVAVTVVVPTSNADPEAGAYSKVAPGQLSETVGAGILTTALHSPESLSTVISAGQLMLGSSVSVTVGGKEHWALLWELVAVAVTVVVPTGNTVPGFC